MPFLSVIKSLYKNLRDALRWQRKICRYAARVNTELQASNASAELKALGTAFLGSAEDLCDAIDDYIAGLPGNSPEVP